MKLSPSLPDPRIAGFRPESLAENVGQVRDWVRPCPDGSRLHLHQMGDGSLWLHRDRIDPGRGVVPALLHIVTETKFGQTVAAVGLFSILMRFSSSN